MAAPPSAYKDRHFLAVIGDEVGTTTLSRLEKQLRILTCLGLCDRLATSWRGSMMP